MESSTDTGSVAAGRPRDADATRLALLRAAQRRFTLLGYDRTTTRDVASDAGVNVALINRYFGGKRGLFEAVVAAAPALLAESGIGHVDQDDLVKDFVEGLRDHAWDEFGGHPLLLLLRDGGEDDDVRSLRGLGLDVAVQALLGSGQRPRSGSKRRREAELRAQLVVALFCGIVSLRSMNLLEPLTSADPDELRGAVDDAVRALMQN